MKKLFILPLLLVLSSAALAKRGDIAFAAKMIMQKGEKIRVLQPMLPIYFEIDGSDAGLAEHEVMVCRLSDMTQKDVSGGQNKALVEDADVECKNGQYHFRVRRVLFETSER